LKPDYKDLYEITAIRNQMIKLAAMLIFYLKEETAEEDEEA
jgi:hypothetical protein